MAADDKAKLSSEVSSAFFQCADLQAESHQIKRRLLRLRGLLVRFYSSRSDSNVSLILLSGGVWCTSLQRGGSVAGAQPPGPMVHRSRAVGAVLAH
jgi:hypothetical protein